MTESLVDLSDAIGEGEEFVCPLCDNALIKGEEVSIFIAHKCYCLGHTACIWDSRNELDV